MIYTEEYLNKHYKGLIFTDITFKMFLTNRHTELFEYQGFEKRGNEVVLFKPDEYIDNKEYFDEKYEKIRLYHVTAEEIERLKSAGIKYTRGIMVQPIKLFDEEYFKWKGKKKKIDRYTTRKYDNMGLEVTDVPHDIEDVMSLLKLWDTNKRASGTLMTFTGYDKAFFNKYYYNCQKKGEIKSHFFYKDDKLIGFTILEQVKPDFWILHMRKSDRYQYTDFDLYIDIYSFRNIFDQSGEPFYVDMGIVFGKKLSIYKDKRFPTVSQVYVWNVTIDKERTKKAKLKKLF